MKLLVNDIANCVIRNVMLLGQHTACHGMSSIFSLYLSLKRFIVFRRWMFFSVNAFPNPNPSAPLSFPGGVFHILFVCPEEKVSWVYTRWIVAVMTHFKRFIKISVFQHPRHSMGWRRCVSGFEHAVTVAKFRPFPNPAFFRSGLFHFFPKSFFNAFVSPPFQSAKFSVFRELVMGLHCLVLHSHCGGVN